ncbi:MAG: hypothetical protein PHV55_08580, partial [Candidatus Omnitrophica bacterium]|nr:hypothetical protein [Candidatus Omnitrophota bacterium]
DSCSGSSIDKFLNGYDCAPFIFALEALTKGQAYLMADPLIMYREENKSRWAGRWPVIYAYYIPQITHSAVALGYREKIYDSIIADIASQLPGFIIYWKSSSKKGVRESMRWIDLVFLYGKYGWFWKKCVYLIITPYWLYARIVLWRKRIRLV